MNRNRTSQRLHPALTLVGTLAAGVSVGLLFVPAGVTQVTNPRPSIFNEAPYLRSNSTPPTSTTPASTTPVTPTGEQPAIAPTTAPVTLPAPEQQQPPVAQVTPVDGMVKITLSNKTNAAINYQVIGDTRERTLAARSDVTLQGIKPPTTVTFRRQDKGLLQVTPMTSTVPGTLSLAFIETTDLGVDKTALVIEATGSVFLN